MTDRGGETSDRHPHPTRIKKKKTAVRNDPPLLFLSAREKVLIT